MEKHEFKAESKRLLEMMINSIYTKKEIFLRELISNASDAYDKLCYQVLTSGDSNVNRNQMEIRIRIDKENRILRISDHGIGMNASEMEENLGIIAKSGSASFKETISDDALQQETIIGQFGVGFYSSFMVADKIIVVSRKYGETQGYRWVSDGVNGYTIQPYDKKHFGTDIILHIRKSKEENSDEFDQYLREYPIYKLIKQYSDYIRYPIRIYMPHPEIVKGSDPKNPEFKESYQYETVNSMIPVWQKQKNEATDEERKAFYREHFKANDEPLRIISADAEGNISFKALLFIPGKLPEDYGTDDFKPGLELYASGVKIMDSCTDILPEEFNFIRGVVDSPDLSINISRELLQRDNKLSQVSTYLTKKIRSELKGMLKNHREDYEKFHDQFGHHLKVCAMDDYGKKKDSLGDMLLFLSGSKRTMITLDEYIENICEGQKFIYYAEGDKSEVIDRIPQLEFIRDSGMDVLYFTDKADSFVARMFVTYKDLRFQSVQNADLSSDADKSGTADEHKVLIEFIKSNLGTKVDDVIVSRRLKSHPVCLTNGNGITFEMERYFKSISPNAPAKAKMILEINADHKALKKLASKITNDKETASKYCEILYQQARMIAGIPVEDPSAYTDLLCSLWE